MTVHVTDAQARQLGVAAPAKPKRTRKAARAPYHSRCTRCGAEFRTQAAEERHVHDTHHARYELVVQAVEA
jgi:hypothetical protein